MSQLFKRLIFFQIILSILIVFFIKVLFSDNLLYITSTFLFELSIFILIYLLYLLLSKKSLILGIIIFYILYLVHFFVCVVFSYFMTDSLGRNLSIFSIFENFNFGIKNIFPWTSFLIIFFLLVILILFSLFLSKYIKKIPNLFKWYFFVIALILLFIIPFIFNNNFENIYVNSFKNINLFSNKSNISYANVDCNQDLNFLEKKNYPDLNLDSKYSKIVVFVMEEVLFDNFYKYQKKIQKEYNFYEQNKLNSHYYFNYYTNNQDSITAIISMISSKFIPNEAYIYTDNYSLCNHNLYYDYDIIDYFNDLNFYTAFYISSVQPACELTKYDWNKIVDIKGKYDELDKTNMCFNPFPYDTACEDKVLLNKLIQDLNKEKVFIMQEFIFGHNNLYQKTSKKSKTEYYNEYFYEFYQKVLENNWQDDLLIILVSDHGNKGIQAYSNLQGYNIPLIFVANDLNYLENYDLLSHLDFKDILLKYNFNIDFNPSKEFFIVGPTASNVVGFFDNNYFALLNKENSNYNLIFSTISNHNYIANKLSCFLKYQNQFNLLVQNI